MGLLVAGSGRPGSHGVADEETISLLKTSHSSVAFVPDTVELGSSGPVTGDSGGVDGPYGERTRKCQDIGVLVVWAIQVSVVSFIAVASGVDCLNSGCVYSQVSLPNSEKPHPLIIPLVTSAIVAIVLCMVQVVVIQKFSKSILKCLMYTTVLSQLLVSFWSFGVNVWIAVILLLSAGVTALYFYFVRNRIAFAAAHLETACAAVRTYPSSICVSFASFFIQVIWVVIWSVAFYGIRSESAGGLGNIMQVAMMWSLLWTLEVIQGIAHCSTCGIVGTWWYSANATGNRPTLQALKRACTTSLGSICFGSLIVSALSLIRIMLTSLRDRLRKLNGPAAFLVGCFVWLARQAEQAAVYLNSYAFAIVGIHGKDFLTSGKEVSALFSERGWTAVINDNLADRVLGVSCIGVACVTGLVGGAACAAKEHTGSWSNTSIRTSALLGFVVGLWMARTVTGVITSAIRTIFVCFARAPTAMAQTHPNLFMKLCEAWQESHLEVFQKCGYREIYAAKRSNTDSLGMA